MPDDSPPRFTRYLTTEYNYREHGSSWEGYEEKEVKEQREEVKK